MVERTKGAGAPVGLSSIQRPAQPKVSDLCHTTIRRALHKLDQHVPWLEVSLKDNKPTSHQQAWTDSAHAWTDDHVVALSEGQAKGWHAVHASVLCSLTAAGWAGCGGAHSHCQLRACMHGRRLTCNTFLLCR